MFFLPWLAFAFAAWRDLAGGRLSRRWDIAGEDLEGEVMAVGSERHGAAGLRGRKGQG